MNQREPKPQGALGEAPAWLTTGQRDVWREAVASAPKGLLTRLDASVLLVWVVAKELHREASEAVARFGMLSETPNTREPIQSPYLAIMNKQALIMLKAAAEMGFTPSSRTRVAVDADPAGNEEWGGF